MDVERWRQDKELFYELFEKHGESVLPEDLGHIMKQARVDFDDLPLELASPLNKLIPDEVRNDPQVRIGRTNWSVALRELKKLIEGVS